MTLADLRMLVTEALRDPRANARRILKMPLSGTGLYEALVLVAIVSTLALFAVAHLAGVPINGMTLPMPVVLVIMQVVVMLFLAGGLRLLGGLFGGKGSFDGALRVIVWLQALMFFFQLIQLFIMVVLPPLAGIFSFLTLGAVFWIATGLIAELHGYKSLWLTLLGTIAGLIVVALAISILLGLFLPTIPV